MADVFGIVRDAIEADPELPEVREALRRAGAGEAWLTGGAVRDALLKGGVRAADYDVALPSFDATFAERLGALLGGTAFLLDAETGAWRVARPGRADVDLIPFRGPDIEADLAGRDFTVNAMAYDLAGGRGLVDPLGGREAARFKVLALCGKATLAEDPLRVLRAYRFAATLGFALAPGLSEVLRTAAPSLKSVSQERVRYEVFRLFGAPGAAKALRMAVEDGVWQVLHPFVAKWKGFDQGSYHAHDLLEHSLLAVEMVEEALASKWFDPVREALNAHLAERLEGDVTRLAHLKWVAFFHDVAKPESLTVEPTGRRRFIGHDALGAKTATRLLIRMKTGRRAARAAGRVIGAHMRLFGLAHQAEPTPRSRLRYLRDLGSETPEAVLLSIADELATGERDFGERRRIWETCAELLTLYFSRTEKVEPLLRGRDLIEMGIPEGPMIGIILAAVADAETQGKVTTKEEAREWVGSFGKIS